MSHLINNAKKEVQLFDPNNTVSFVCSYKNCCKATYFNAVSVDFVFNLKETYLYY